VRRIWQTERRDRVLLLARHVENAATAGEHAQVRTCCEKGVYRYGRIGHLLEVIEHQEHVALANVVHEPINSAAAAAVREPERLRDRGGHEIRLGDRRQLHEEDAITIIGHRAACDLEAEPRLAGAARPGKRQQAAPLEELADLTDLALAAEEGRQARRQIVRDRVEGRDRRKVAGQIGDDELPQMLRMLDVPEPMLAEVAQLDLLGKSPTDQGAGGVREQHLSPVRDIGDAAGAMDMEPDVSIGPDAGLAGVQAHAHADGDARRPGLRVQRALRRDGRGHPARRRGEHDEKGVSFRPDLDATLHHEGRAQQLLVSSKD